jgi:putative transposase
MIRIRLDEATRTELQAQRRTALPAVARDRLEMLLLSEAGWSPPRIAKHLGRYPQTVRNFLHDFQARGIGALYPDRPGPAPDLARRDHVVALLRELVGQDRTWTSLQLAEALRERGVELGGRQVRRYLKALKAGYRRTASTLEHKQDRAKVERAEGTLASAQAKAGAGRLRPFYLDESGFAPSLPLGYSWCLPGQRKRVKYEYPQGRRVNVLAAYEACGPTPWLDAQAFERTLTGEDLLAYLRQRLPAAGVPRVVVLDNASMHTSKAFKAHRKALAGEGIYLYYLPAYSPQLNKIEGIFKQVKHHEIVKRSHTSKAELRLSVEQGFDSYARKLREKPCGQSRPAA